MLEQKAYISLQQQALQPQSSILSGIQFLMGFSNQFGSPDSNYTRYTQLQKGLELCVFNATLLTFE